jgi:hypothetical protein
MEKGIVNWEVGLAKESRWNRTSGKIRCNMDETELRLRSNTSQSVTPRCSRTRRRGTGKPRRNTSSRLTSNLQGSSESSLVSGSMLVNIETSAEAMAGFGAEGRASGEVNDMARR